MLRKLLKFCAGFNDPASFDEQFISLDFSPKVVLQSFCVYLQSASSSEVYRGGGTQANDEFDS